MDNNKVTGLHYLGVMLSCSFTNKILHWHSSALWGSRAVPFFYFENKKFHWRSSSSVFYPCFRCKNFFISHHRRDICLIFAHTTKKSILFITIFLAIYSVYCPGYVSNITIGLSYVHSHLKAIFCWGKYESSSYIHTYIHTYIQVNPIRLA